MISKKFQCELSITNANIKCFIKYFKLKIMNHLDKNNNQYFWIDPDLMQLAFT